MGFQGAGPKASPLFFGFVFTGGRAEERQEIGIALSRFGLGLASCEKWFGD
jgi:hypothetical protein